MKLNALQYSLHLLYRLTRRSYFKGKIRKINVLQSSCVVRTSKSLIPQTFGDFKSRNDVRTLVKHVCLAVTPEIMVWKELRLNLSGFKL